MSELLNVPPKSEYKKGKSSEKVNFSYPGEQKHFQIDYYGINPNASIAGTLHLRFPSSEPILATRIDLAFIGYEKVEWKEKRGESTVTFRAKDTFVNQLYQLWTTSDPNGNYEEIRNMDIPFEFKLIENLPPSIKIDAGRGKIRYKLIAIIKRKGNLLKFKGSEKRIELSIDFQRFYSPSIHLEPFNWNQLNDTEAITRGLGYDVTLDNSIGGPNMPFIINMLLKFHKQDFRISKVFFGIKEYHKLIVKKHTRKSSFYLVEKNIKGDEIRLNFNGEVNTQVRLEIPEWNKNSKSSWTINDRKTLTVGHKIKIKIHCGGIFTSNIKLEKEVEVRNILMENRAVQNNPNNSNNNYSVNPNNYDNSNNNYNVNPNNYDNSNDYNNPPSYNNPDNYNTSNYNNPNNYNPGNYNPGNYNNPNNNNPNNYINSNYNNYNYNEKN